MASGQAHADAWLDGAVYDLYAAEDIQHPDGVTGTVDYSKITYPDGTPIWPYHHPGQLRPVGG